MWSNTALILLLHKMQFLILNKLIKNFVTLFRVIFHPFDSSTRVKRIHAIWR